MTMKARKQLALIVAATGIALSATSAQACFFQGPACQGESARACPTQEDRRIGGESCAIDKEALIQGASRAAAGGVEMAMRVMRAVAEEIDRQLRPADDI